MKNVIIKTVVLSTLIFSACSNEPSKEEKEARETLRNDSLMKAAKQDSLMAIARQDSINSAVSSQDTLKQQVINLKSQLAAEQSKLDDIQSKSTGILGTSEADKAQQIANQTKVVETLKSQISDAEKQIK